MKMVFFVILLIVGGSILGISLGLVFEEIVKKIKGNKS
jgi:hypothetical protein